MQPPPSQRGRSSSSKLRSRHRPACLQPCHQPASSRQRRARVDRTRPLPCNQGACTCWLATGGLVALFHLELHFSGAVAHALYAHTSNRHHLGCALSTSRTSVATPAPVIFEPGQALAPCVLPVPHRPNCRACAICMPPLTTCKHSFLCTHRLLRLPSPCCSIRFLRSQS